MEFLVRLREERILAASVLMSYWSAVANTPLERSGMSLGGRTGRYLALWQPWQGRTKETSFRRSRYPTVVLRDPLLKVTMLGLT
jgi:hypothetical protein